MADFFDLSFLDEPVRTCAVRLQAALDANDSRASLDASTDLCEFLAGEYASETVVDDFKVANLCKAMATGILSSAVSAIDRDHVAAAGAMVGAIKLVFYLAFSLGERHALATETPSKTTKEKLYRLTHKVDLTDEEKIWLAHYNR